MRLIRFLRKVFRLKKVVYMESIKEAKKSWVKAQGYIIQVNAYCENPRCTVRDVVMLVKEFYREETKEPLKCPSCDHVLNLHGVRSLRAGGSNG